MQAHSTARTQAIVCKARECAISLNCERREGQVNPNIQCIKGGFSSFISIAKDPVYRVKASKTETQVLAEVIASLLAGYGTASRSGGE